MTEQEKSIVCNYMIAVRAYYREIEGMAYRHGVVSGQAAALQAVCEHESMRDFQPVIKDIRLQSRRSQKLAQMPFKPSPASYEKLIEAEDALHARLKQKQRSHAASNVKQKRAKSA